MVVGVTSWQGPRLEASSGKCYHVILPFSPFPHPQPAIPVSVLKVSSENNHEPGMGRAESPGWRISCLTTFRSHTLPDHHGTMKDPLI